MDIVSVATVANNAGKKSELIFGMPTINNAADTNTIFLEWFKTKFFVAIEIFAAGDLANFLLAKKLLESELIIANRNILLRNIQNKIPKEINKPTSLIASSLLNVNERKPITVVKPDSKFGFK